MQIIVKYFNCEKTIKLFRGSGNNANLISIISHKIDLQIKFIFTPRRSSKYLKVTKLFAK